MDAKHHDPGKQAPKKIRKKRKLSIAELIQTETVQLDEPNTHVPTKRKKHRHKQSDLEEGTSNQSSSNLDNISHEESLPTLSVTCFLENEAANKMDAKDHDPGKQAPKKMRKKQKLSIAELIQTETVQLDEPNAHVPTKRKKHRHKQSDLVEGTSNQSSSNLDNISHEESLPTLSVDDHPKKKKKKKKHRLESNGLEDEEPQTKKKNKYTTLHSPHVVLNKVFNIVEPVKEKSLKKKSSLPSPLSISHKGKESKSLEASFDENQPSTSTPKKAKHKHRKLFVFEPEPPNSVETNSSQENLTTLHESIVSDNNISTSSIERTPEPHRFGSINADDLQESLELMEECLKVNEKDLELLRNLRIIVPQEIPLSHRIETRMSSHPTHEQRQEFDQLPIKMKTGSYTKTEDEIIKHNWKEFCRVNNIPDNPEPFLVFTIEPKNKTTTLSKLERIKFVQFLGQGLDNRMLNSIYRRFKTLMQWYKKGKFTAEEDAIILKYLGTIKSNNVHSDLAKLLQRTRDSIQKRCEYLLKNKQSVEVKWDIQLMQELIENLMEVTEKTVVNELKNLKITSSQWKEISLKMDIPVRRLQSRWFAYLHPRLFSSNFDDLFQLREEIITILYKEYPNDRRSIDWTAVAKHFNGMTAMKIYKIFSDLLSRNVPKEIRSNYNKYIKYLKKVYLIEARDLSKKIKKFDYVRGSLVEL